MLGEEEVADGVDAEHVQGDIGGDLRGGLFGREDARDAVGEVQVGGGGGEFVFAEVGGGGDGGFVCMLSTIVLQKL